MSAQMETSFPVKTPAGLAELSRNYYAGQHWRWRLVQPLRAYICPFADVIDLVPRDSKVLDVGCGSGLFLLFLASFGKLRRGVGFDVSEEAVATANVARQRLADPDLLHLAVRAVEQGIPPGDWTVVSAIDVIHHIPPAHQPQFIRDLCAATPPGARLIIKDMVAQPMWRAMANRLHDLLMAKQWVHHVSPEQVESWVTDPAMSCVHRSRRNMLWYGHWTLVFERKAEA
jgi:2-polyprenyl-3-methyl-5-hydroxy-6-metoxy-1,4-benzoquinol methylase